MFRASAAAVMVTKALKRSHSTYGGVALADVRTLSAQPTPPSQVPLNPTLPDPIPLTAAGKEFSPSRGRIDFDVKVAGFFLSITMIVFTALTYHMDSKFDSMATNTDTKFVAMTANTETKFVAMTTNINSNFEAMTKLLESIDKRMETRMDRIENKLDALLLTQVPQAQKK
ncbi:hypothetical protein BASA81_001914 [Batrachochytrium salamandrivorans]|nr:hypothetical protein BASA81_001914 [Batrachochytrium salamandrivorans]